MSASQHLAGIAVAVVLGVAAVLPASQRDAPVSIEAAEITTPTVEPGHDLRIRYTVHRDKICRTTSYVTIFDGADVEWRIEPVSRAAIGPLGGEIYVVRHTIPMGATPGHARYRLVLDFICNWTHRIVPVTTIMPDLGFEIGDPDG